MINLILQRQNKTLDVFQSVSGSRMVGFCRDKYVFANHSPRIHTGSVSIHKKLPVGDALSSKTEKYLKLEIIERRYKNGKICNYI